MRIGKCKSYENYRDSVYASITIAVCLFIIFLITVCLSVGCAPVKGLTQEETNLLRFYNFYNTQYDDYQSMTENVDNLSEEKKVVLRKKKEMLIELHRLIRLYEFQININNADNIKTEQMIYDLLNKIE